MDGATAVLKEKLNRLLIEAAQVSVALDRADGTITRGSPLFRDQSTAKQLGQQLSRRDPSPTDGGVGRGADGHSSLPEMPNPLPAQLQETHGDLDRRRCRSRGVQGYCSACRRAFSPDRETLGFDARELTPLLIQRMTFAAAETRSFERAGLVMRNVGDQSMSAKTIERVVHDVGWELPSVVMPIPGLPTPWPSVPRVPGIGRRRVRWGTDSHPRARTWSRRAPHHRGLAQTKNACLIRAQHKTFDHDPQPEPPECFCDPKHVAKIAETEALSVAAPHPLVSRSDRKREPRYCIAAGRRRLASKQLVVRFSAAWLLPKISASKWRGKRNGGGSSRRGGSVVGRRSPWNWWILWKAHFPDFTAILDFIHVLSYLFVVAKAVHQDPEEAWSQYLVWMRGCWQGEVARRWRNCGTGKLDWVSLPKKHPTTTRVSIVATTITYLENNQNRMHYPEYRGQGLPVDPQRGWNHW